RGYNTYNRPGVHRTHDNAWLWALPVVAIAFIALSQHGHHSSHPVFVAHNPRPAYIYRAQPARHGPFIVSQRQNITVRQQVVRQPAPFRRNPAVVSLRTPPMRFRNQHVASRPAAPPFFRPGARPMQPMRHPARVAVAPRKPATRVAFRPAHRAPANTGPVARKRRAFFAHHQAKPVAVQPAPPLRKIAWHRTSLPRPSHPAMKTAPRQTIPARAAQHRPQITPGHQMRPGHQNAAASFTRPMPHRMAHPMRSNPIRPPAYHPPSGPPMAHAAQQHSNRPAAMVANRPAPMASNNKGHFQKGNHGNKHNGHK
ncbi:MAG TPA: hypothetical protein VFW40_09185, partial [Capsulimonadaceae bacterium]|nr:hypothetical protein [Capsulimonadaceae bacterium]